MAGYQNHQHRWTSDPNGVIPCIECGAPTQLFRRSLFAAAAGGAVQA